MSAPTNNSSMADPLLAQAYQQGYMAAQAYQQGYQAGLSSQGNMLGMPVAALSKQQILQKYAEMDRSAYIALAICAIVAIAFTVAAAEEDTATAAQMWFWICAGTFWGFTLLCLTRLYNNGENKQKELRALQASSNLPPA